MTADQWNAATSPEPMLEFLRGKASDRKMRLFAVACCRTSKPRVSEHKYLRAVNTAEHFADGTATSEELRQAQSAVAQGLELYGGEPVFEPSFWACGQDIQDEISGCVFYSESRAADGLNFSATDHDEQAARVRAVAASGLAALLRDIFNPFSPPHFAPSFRTSTVLALAARMYESSSFEAMSLLADALQDVGCPDDSELIRHCRGTGPHVKGCHVLDAILGRS